MMTEAQTPISFWHPAKLLGTWFGPGLSPFAPGTVGSAAAIPFAWVILWFGGVEGLAIATLLCFVVGCWACEIYGRETGKKDASELVIDEVAGMWLTLLLFIEILPHLFFYGLEFADLPLEYMLHPLVSVAIYGCAFLMFRLFDIWKPWPVSWADRKVKGGLGVMLDDIFAGLYPSLILLGAMYVCRYVSVAIGIMTGIDG